jgi:hypothetical protein
MGVGVTQPEAVSNLCTCVSASVSLATSSFRARFSYCIRQAGRQAGVWGEGSAGGGGGVGVLVMSG